MSDKPYKIVPTVRDTPQGIGKERKEKEMKALSLIVKASMIVFLLYVAICYVDIVSDNLSAEPHHWSYNIFVMLTSK